MSDASLAYADLSWAIDASESRVAAEVQQRLKYFVIDEKWLDKFFKQPKHNGPVSLSRCRFQYRSISVGDADYFMVDDARSVTGVCIHQSRPTRKLWPRRRPADTLRNYCGILLTDGKTFELVTRRNDPKVIVGYGNGEPICRLEEVDYYPRPLPLTRWGRIKRAICGPRRWKVYGSGGQIGEVELHFPIGSNRRTIYLQTSVGLLPIQVMRPRWLGGQPDLVIPEETPAIDDAELAITHFLVNVAFRLMLFHLDDMHR